MKDLFSLLLTADNLSEKTVNFDKTPWQHKEEGSVTVPPQKYEEVKEILQKTVSNFDQIFSNFSPEQQTEIKTLLHLTSHEEHPLKVSKKPMKKLDGYGLKKK